MGQVKISDLPQYTGSVSGGWLLLNNPTQTKTYKVLREDLLSGTAQAADVSSSFARVATTNTFSNIQTFNSAITGTSAYFNGKVTINGTASIALLETVNQQSLQVGDKYIIIQSGGVDHVGLDGAGILWGSGAVGEPTIDENGAQAYVKYRNTGDQLEIFPGLRVSGSITASVGFSGNGAALTSLTASNITNFASDVRSVATGSNAPYLTIRTITTNTTALLTDCVILLNANNIILTLPTAVGNTGKVYYIKNLSTTGTQTIRSNGGTVEGAAAGTGIPTTTRGNSDSNIIMVSDGTNWWELGTH